MHRGLVAALLVGVLALAGVAVGTAGGVVADATGGTVAAVQEDVDADDVLLAITVEPDGDAAWRIEYRVRLETDEDEQAFADLQADVENNTTAYEQRFHDRMNATAESAAETTGREMTITDVRVSAERRQLPREYGVVTYRFRWTDFAAVDGDRATAGDALDGLFLDEDTTLRVAWTADHGLLGATPAPDETRDRAVVWNGPTSFAGGEPRVELGPPGAASDGGPSVSDSPTAFATLLVVLLVGTAAVAFVYYRGRARVAPGPGSPEGDTGGGDAAGADAAGPAGGSADDGVDTELLSNEEQVLRLVERNGGRMKQRAVAEDLGWTDAKTSQVTKGLREDGALEGFRLGRENVLALPGERDDGEGGANDAGGESDADGAGTNGNGDDAERTDG